jgi:hypothetical protein
MWFGRILFISYNDLGHVIVGTLVGCVPQCKCMEGTSPLDAMAQTSKGFYRGDDTFDAASTIELVKRRMLNNSR